MSQTMQNMAIITIEDE